MEVFGKYAKKDYVVNKYAPHDYVVYKYATKDSIKDAVGRLAQELQDHDGEDRGSVNKFAAQNSQDYGWGVRVKRFPHRIMNKIGWWSPSLPRKTIGFGA